MKQLYFFLSFLLITTISFAQTSGTIKGKLIDSVGKQSLKDASVTVLDSKDSTLEVFGLAKTDGSFELKNIALGKMIVQITFEGYRPVNKTVTLSKENTVVDLGEIAMIIQSKDLQEVVVQSSPIIIKKDTIEYNAGSFKTKPNAVVEDLLKKLPGVQVDKSGSITAQGESVQRVLVNGKRFFGDDPKMATKNLPPDMVDKIQVFDDLSDQSKFTGFDDGNRVKTINITTKKNKNKGYFGKVVAGGGTDGAFDESANIHRFDGTQQLSLLGQANDINKQNFTTQDILGTSSGGRGGIRNATVGNGSSSSGITTTWAGGMNYKDSWGKRTDAYGSYFYNDQKTPVNQSSLVENATLTDSSLISNQSQLSITHNQSHRINFNLESKLDSLNINSLVIRPNISFQQSTPSYSSSTITSINKTGLPTYSSISNGYSKNTGYSISGANFQYRHKFAKPFRTMSLDVNVSANSNDGMGYTYSVNKFYTGSNNQTDTLDQYNISSLRSSTISPTLSYTEPLSKNQILEFKYSYSNYNSNSINNTYQRSIATKSYSQLDSLFSNSFNNSTISNRFTLSYRLQKNKYNISVSSGIQSQNMTSNNIVKNVNIDKNYLFWTPSVNFQYNFSTTNSIRFFYNGNAGQPSISQLQPIKTTSDSINFQIGNPDLKPQFTNAIRVLYHAFNPFTQQIVIATVNASAITNDIQNSITTNRNGGRTTTYANLSGTFKISGFFDYGFAIKKPKSNLNFITNLGYNQSQNLLSDLSGNTRSNFTYNSNLGETLSWTTNLKENFDVNFSAGITYYIANQSIGQNTSYTTNTFSTEATYYTKSGFILATDFDYTYSANRPAGYNASVPLINPSIAMQIFKNKQGELRLSCFDLLNQNVSVNQSVANGSITNTKTNVLTRYFMLTFTYNLSKFAGQGQKMPGMFRSMMRGMGGANAPRF
jgi:hypothetical protein